MPAIQTNTARAAGSDTQVQYNASGGLGASADFKWRDFEGLGSTKKALYLWGGGTSDKGFTFWYQDGIGGHNYNQIQWANGVGVLSFGDGSSSSQPLLGFYSAGGSMCFGSDFGYGAYMGGTLRFTTTGIGFFGQNSETVIIDGGQVNISDGTGSLNMAGGSLTVNGNPTYSGPLNDSASNQIADVINGLITGVYY